MHYSHAYFDKNKTGLYAHASKKEHHVLPREQHTCTIEFGMDEDSVLDKSLMRLSTMVEEPNYTILPAFRKYTIYWEHVTIKKFFDGSIEMKRSGIY